MPLWDDALRYITDDGTQPSPAPFSPPPQPPYDIRDHIRALLARAHIPGGPDTVYGAPSGSVIYNPQGSHLGISQQPGYSAMYGYPQGGVRMADPGILLGRGNTQLPYMPQVNPQWQYFHQYQPFVPGGPDTVYNLGKDT